MRNRRDSDKGKRKGKIPVPVSVSLFNLCPLSWEKQVEQNKNKKVFRPEHALALLHQVRLEIVIAPRGRNGKDQESNDTGGEEKVIFSSLAPVKTVNPSWNHLDECIEDYLALDGYFDSETGFYRFMRLRIWIVPEGLPNADKVVEGGDDNKQTPQSDEEDETKQPLLDISIHPTKLRRLATMPNSLPVNSLIFNFSDGSIRATARLLDLVGDQDGSHQEEHLKDEFARFGDDVFRTLDQVTPVKKAKNEPTEGQANSNGNDQSILSTSASEDSNDGRILSALREPNDQATQECLFHKELLSGTEKARFETQEPEISLKDANAERQYLERLIQQEEDALAEEAQLLQEEKSQLGAAIGEAGIIQNNLQKLASEIDSELQLCRQSEFFLEARRMKLLRDLRTIYPISFLEGEDRYCIRDLRIPADIHSNVVAEDELSAAFGYLCHLVSLISKYLAIQLRHRLFCNSSRSAIQEDGGPIYPLFQGRVVEREQLDHGVRLLQRNIECILKTRDIEQNPGEHILVNVKKLFDSFVDGKE
ncbi:UV radiation resistance [Seminavis robusta]|uniref:UV radiation resistance n=1 Tax=Seminavis robusta TaxID=568900 RepID=A0A9N8DNA9_9STRA|nr:UV radiation resistance [Seminavis robusta]|eukprot:Sro174_g076850.1 UV radiation resistance (535) ;mRNA; r:96609-98423